MTLPEAYGGMNLDKWYSVIFDEELARMFWDYRLGQIGGGASEIMCEIISRILIDSKQYAEPKLKVK